MEYETFKFKNFELTLESGDGECTLEIDNNSKKSISVLNLIKKIYRTYLMN